MKYKIIDTQLNSYFSQGEIFNSKKEVCERLIDYHSIDCDMEVEKFLLQENKIDECWNELSYFDWELEEVNQKLN